MCELHANNNPLDVPDVLTLKYNVWKLAHGVAGNPSWSTEHAEGVNPGPLEVSQMYKYRWWGVIYILLWITKRC